MSDEPERNWWTYSIDPDVRAKKMTSRFTGSMDVNPELPGGLRRLDYHGYLGLDRLLRCQAPSSSIPDERVFIVTHQLMEIVFKMVIFDMAVIATTLRAFSDFSVAPNELLSAKSADDEFWRPALTASARVSFACRELLPSVMRFLWDPKDADETFSSIEFHRFRENLEPASGFQSAQFRLIQRALGKANLLRVRLFPADTYRRLYGDRAGELVRVDDSVILREDSVVASPPDGSPLGAVAQLDDVAHAALARLAPLGDADSGPPDRIHPAEIERAAGLLERILLGRRRDARRAGAGAQPFRSDLEAAAARENDRRDGLGSARAGAQALRRKAPNSPLARVLARLAAADEALHGTGQDSFLSVHLRVTRERLRQVKAYAAKIGDPEPVIGTGGGGVEYLGWSQRYLIPLFPALIAYRELGD